MFKEVGILGGLVVCYLLVLFFQSILPADYSLVGWLIGAALLIAIAVITRFSIGHWLLFVLFITHALVGAVELGTDGWIQNIMGNMLSSEEGKILFIWTSACMFGLRFCANRSERRRGGKECRSRGAPYH